MRPRYRRRPGQPGRKCLRHPNRPARWRGRPLGWRGEPYRHSMSSRGIKNSMKGYIRGISPAISSTFLGDRAGIDKIKKEDPEGYIMANDLAYEYLERNNWSRDDAVSNLEEERQRLGMEYKTTKDPEIAREMNVIKVAEMIAGWRSEDLVREWPEMRDDVMLQYEVSL